MKRFLFLFVVLFSSVLIANPKDFWGQTGHRVVGDIAYNNLSKKAKKNIEKLIGEESLAMLSTYADEIKSDKRYDNFKPWHYINLKDGETYNESEKNPKGDLVTGINKCIEVLKSNTETKEQKVFYFKMLVHLMGDLHQPLHIGRKKDLGGNKLTVKWFYKTTNIHSVWDSKMIDSYNMSYTELSYNIDIISKDEIEEIQQGTLLDWVDDTNKLSDKVYNSIKQNKTLSYRYMYDYFGIVKIQLEKGGLRLAKVLNDLFG